MHPDWVEKHHIEGTSIKEKNGNYYLYKVTSKRVKGKSYPVAIQKYIGKITPDGLIKPERVYFSPGIDKVVPILELCDEVENKDITVMKLKIKILQF